MIIIIRCRVFKTAAAANVAGRRCNRFCRPWRRAARTTTAAAESVAVAGTIAALRAVGPGMGDAGSCAATRRARNNRGRGTTQCTRSRTAADANRHGRRHRRPLSSSSSSPSLVVVVAAACCRHRRGSSTLRHRWSARSLATRARATHLY